ncbi:ABC-three component system middle component 5, partial [Citrobacter freundii]
ENIQNPNRIFVELRRIQSIAFYHLLSKQLIDMKSFENGMIKRTETNLPDQLVASLNEAAIKKNKWFILVSKEFQKIEFYGANGLKKRTGLMEYRYDEVEKNG